MMPVAVPVKPSKTAPPRLLVVDDESSLIDLVGDAVERNLECRLSTAGTIAEARQILAKQPVDLLVVDLNLPDGSGTDLLADLRRKYPTAGAIVITGTPSLRACGFGTSRGGCRFPGQAIPNRRFSAPVANGLASAKPLAKNETRIDRLRDAVRRLNEARKVVAKKVDLLCNDLINAYGDLSRQLDTVRISESFRARFTARTIWSRCFATRWTGCCGRLDTRMWRSGWRRSRGSSLGRI